ncbi:MAG: peptide chain release factor N(5)-glutamine methyltransferase [Rhodobacteraceae bacterium]|nr:peptide chain release factor N(5)-glutamine methyltransferase [Paracoccaceae bacterium]
MILREALAAANQRLRAAGIPDAPRDARALLAEAAGLAPDRVLLEGNMDLHDVAGFEAMVTRRIAGEPVSKIIGHRMFWGREFTVTKDTLDPRPETETLIAAALEMAPVDRFADLGTGSGIIAVTLLAEWPEARAVATDLSPAALDVAKRNAALHGVSERLTFLRSEVSEVWFPEGIGECDMILSNPPYITEDEMQTLAREVYDHDPHVALTPGGDGLDAYRVIAGGAMMHLRQGGKSLVEIGWTQGASVAALFRDAGFVNVHCVPDLDGRDRIIVAERP